MKLAIIVSVLTIIYIAVMLFFILELKAHPSKKERRENQSIPMLVISTIVYALIVSKIIRFSFDGILPFL